MQTRNRAVGMGLLAALLSLAMAALARAQITITAEDFPGDQIGYRQQMFAAIDLVYGSIPINVGLPGENQTWDFSRMALNMTAYTLAVNEASYSNFREYFPYAEVAITALPGFEFFYKKTTSDYQAFGFVYANLQLGQMLMRVCPAPLKDLQFPLTYGSSWTSQQTCTTFNGVQQVPGTLQQKNTVDGWGIIRLPAGTFPCLRIKVEIEEQSVNPLTGYPESSRTFGYIWITKDAFTIAEVQSRPNEFNPNFNQATLVILAAQVPVAPPPAVITQRAEPEPPPVSPSEPMRPIKPVNPLPPESLSPGAYYALVIAIQDYQDESIKDLDHPIQDGQNLINTLITYYTFESLNLTFLKNPERRQIIDAFDKLSQRLTENDNLLIFYAGHGYWDERLKQGFWLPADAKQASRVDWLSNATIRDYIQGIKSKHTLLISDACFGGGILRTRTAFSGASRAITELYKLPSRKAMTSSTGTLNVVPDKSVFLEFLIKRLKENTDPFLNAENLFVRFREAVINNSPISQIPQYGEIRETGDEGGDFVLVRRK